MSAPITVPERLTKPTIVVSLFVAAWTQSFVVPSSGWAVAAFMLAWTMGRLAPVLARRVVLFTTYLAPAAFVAAYGRFVEAEWLVWIALVCGLMLSTGAPTRWSLPERWKLPLVYWGLLAACAWPLVTLREADFYPSQLPLLGGWPATVAMGVMVGILWFDWLYSVYHSGAGASLEMEVLLPLGLGWVLAASIGIYQMLGQMTFLNPGLWAYFQRATGLSGDGNVFGVTSAVWGPALVAAASARASRWTGWWVAATALPLSWMAVWASGSRSSWLIALLGLLGVLVGLWRSARPKPVVLVTGCAILALAALGVVAVVRGGTLAAGPIWRFNQGFSPDWSVGWMRQMAVRLWAREGYGTAAMAMIRRFPFVGVGLSAFYDLVSVFSWKLSATSLRPDNAQNWFRHEFAELGILGSLGWIVWTTSFLFVLLTVRLRPSGQVSGTIVRFLLVGLGLVSLVGMPGQSLAVSFTFWTLAFWFLSETAAEPQPAADPVRSSRLAWVALWLLVVGHTAGTAYVGWTALRPPTRAQWAGLNYFLGIYSDGDPQLGEFHWTKQRAVAVMPVPKRWLEITVAVNRADIEQVPVDVRVWIDRKLTLRTRLRTSQPITRYIRVSDGEDRIMLETWVNRVARAGGVGNTDPREQGLLLRWNFVDAPPPDATIAGG